MKFKKFLCLTLATTIAFTATLSSSASIFADDIGIKENEKGQNFALSIFDELLELSDENTIENPDDYGISPMWLPNDHENIIRKGIKGEGLSISEDNIKIMANSAKIADTVYGTNVSTVKNRLKCLHGAKNYVASLKFLWNFALNLYNKQSTTNAKNNALNSLPQSLRTDSDMTNMANKLANYINNNTTSTQYSKRKFIICGFACHLISDTFAHRVIVPSTSVKDFGKTKTNSKFGKNDFYSNKNAITDTAKLKAFAKDASNKIGNNKKVKCWQAFKQTVTLGVMEFRDIKHYTIKKDGSIYEDNSSFCKYRYDESKLAVGDFLGSFSGGFDAFIYYPVCGAVLNNFYGYTKTTDKSLLSFLTTKEWEKISTKSAV